MTRLSPPQLELIRVRPQETKLHLSIFEPSTALAARVNGSITKGEMNIPYDTVSEGSFTNVISGMTMLVGTAPGKSDLGRIRVRSATSNTIVVAENSNIAWADDAYLTVLKYWEVWPVYPRIIHDPNNIENVIFYKDFDVAYTNQNSILGSFVCSGPHRAKYLDNGQASVFYSSSGTTNLLGNSMGHFWEFEGGSPSVFAGPEPGYVQYNTPGHYVTKHTVTGSNGSSDVSYRYVSMYPRPNVGNPTTIQDFTIESINGSRDSGGFTSKITIHQPITSRLIPGMVVVIFSENLYGGTPLSLGGNYINNEDIFFVGYILEGTIRYDYEDSSVEFELGSVTELMKEDEGFSISVEDSRSPDTWYKLLDLDCRRAMYHYLRWQSTVLPLTDFHFVGDDRAIQFFDCDRGSLYDAINGFLSSTLVGELVSDRQGGMWAEVSAAASPSIINPKIMDITKRDWMNEPSIREQIDETFSYIELGGIAYSGATGTFSALMSCAPGAAPSYHGGMERNQGLALLGQDQLNTLSGNLLANRNSRFPEIDMNLAGTYYNLDIAPQQRVDITINPSETYRNVFITGSYTVRSLSYQFDSEDLLLLSSVGWREVLAGQRGETITIPDVPPGGGFSNPPFSIPVLAPFGVPASQELGGGDYIQLSGGDPSFAIPDYLSFTIVRQRGTTFTLLPDSKSISLNRTGWYQTSIVALGTVIPVNTTLDVPTMLVIGWQGIPTAMTILNPWETAITTTNGYLGTSIMFPVTAFVTGTSVIRGVEAANTIPYSIGSVLLTLRYLGPF
jgi:hypothetical protein